MHGGHGRGLLHHVPTTVYFSTPLYNESEAQCLCISLSSPDQDFTSPLSTVVIDAGTLLHMKD